MDPGLSADLNTAIANEMTLEVPWEDLTHGPSGEYVTVIDVDAQGRGYDGVDLDAPEILAQDGLPPSDVCREFRQQMVYAVAMRTIHNFERALGRPVQWVAVTQGNRRSTQFQRRLNIYPHYEETPNAYYIRGSGLHMGYFRGEKGTPFDNVCIFTSLSQDTITHELTHAIIDGMDITFEGEHPDVGALHEAFADLVALLQHFQESDFLRAQVSAARGDLTKMKMLGAVALQFGQAIHRPDGIRNALGYTDTEGVWHTRLPDPTVYANTASPHERGDLLVAAIFAAFVKIYNSRVADILRIASRGTGILAEGELPPDLTERLTFEMSKTAQHLLEMSISALDYLPPVSATFGDFVRAIITADTDTEPRDALGYRVALIEAFRSYGLAPSNTTALSAEAFLWPPPTDDERSILAGFVKRTMYAYWTFPPDREGRWKVIRRLRNQLKAELQKSSVKTVGSIDLRAPFNVVSLHPRQRGGASGDLPTQWVIKLVQGSRNARGCTLILDTDSGMMKYRIERERHADVTSSGPVQIIDLAKHTSPAEHSLRVFAFDPSAGVELDTAALNETAIQVPWEREIQPGPVSEYLEVIDRDPASRCSYAPVDITRPYLLAQRGLAPSEGNPQFHQQMVYAVAMRTIRTFERSLGRLATWSPKKPPRGHGPDRYIQRLRIYPHAIREANAYYSPSKKALLFGYFSAQAQAPGPWAATPTVFTCLSHDIIVHEASHALLDGMHHRYVEPSNPDVRAFHEAFADIVALFQHFALPDVLKHQIAATRGDLSTENRLAELAQQFGQAIGRRGALRGAIGERDQLTGEWQRRKPNPQAYQRQDLDPYERASILVAAVFDAFLGIYNSRVASLIRVASDGSGILPEGRLHPDLVARLATEAAASAEHVLRMCIRALDYCPPVDITFGEYLRAIVTADFEYDPKDRWHRRVAFVEAFRNHGIFPPDASGLTVDALLWHPSTIGDEPEVIISPVLSWAKNIQTLGLSQDRRELFQMMARFRGQLHEALERDFPQQTALFGQINTQETFEVHSARPAIWTNLEGKPRFQWMIGLIQTREERLEDLGAFPFRSGATLLVDARTGRLRYSIRKPWSSRRLAVERQYRLNPAGAGLAATYFSSSARDKEPFAVLHRE